MNKKIMLLIPFFALALFILSCSPESGLTSEEQELFGEEGALAGQAIALGCRDVSVESCTDIAGSAQTTTASRTDRSGRVTPDRSTSFADRCQSGNTAFDYSCASATSLRLCRTQCEGSETCNTGRCTTTCGNGLVDRGETCSSCPADVRCRTGEICREGRCVAPVALPTCGNGRLDRGETCSSCPSDIRCSDGEVCQSGACVPINPPLASNVQGATAPVAIRTTENQVTVSVGSSPVVQLDATTTTNLAAVGVQISGSKVVVTNAVGISHLIYVRNSRNNGAYVCPSAQTLAEVSPTCIGVISYTNAQCRDATFTACQYDAVSNSYVVSVTGTGADESAPAEICDGIDNNANSQIDEGCPVPSVNSTNTTAPPVPVPSVNRTNATVPPVPVPSVNSTNTTGNRSNSS